MIHIGSIYPTQEVTVANKGLLRFIYNKDSLVKNTLQNVMSFWWVRGILGEGHPSKIYPAVDDFPNFPSWEMSGNSCRVAVFSSDVLIPSMGPISGIEILQKPQAVWVGGTGEYPCISSWPRNST